MKKFLILFTLTSLVSCGCPKHLPSEQVNVRDSVAVHYIDSTVIHHKTKYKDIAWLGDTLKIEGNRARSWAYADTTREALIGGLEEDEVKERIVYKDRLVYRDSIQIKEVPVEVEVEKIVEKVPKWSWWTLAISVLAVVYVGLKIYLSRF